MIFKKFFTKSSGPYLPLLIIGHYDLSELEKNLQISESDRYIVDEVPIKIEQIRMLISWISLKPLYGKYKLVYLKDADSLTADSANALLKTIEEPPNYLIFILQTLEEQKILPMIISRLQKIRLPINEPSEIPDEYLSPDKLAKMSVSDRFKWVNNIYESQDLNQIIALWQDYYRKKLLEGFDVLHVLKTLLSAKDLLKTNISVKLLLENLVLNFG